MTMTQDEIMRKFMELEARVTLLELSCPGCEKFDITIKDKVAEAEAAEADREKHAAPNGDF